MERKRKEELREKYEAIFSGDDDLHKRLRGTCGGSSSSNDNNNGGIYKLFKL